MINSSDFDFVSLLEKALSGVPEDKLESIGTVVKVGDGVAQIHGLDGALYYELVTFDGGNKGIVLNLDENFASVVFFDKSVPVLEREIVRRTGKIFKIPVSDEMIGRVVNATGEPLDGLGEIQNQTMMPVERSAPGILERSKINESLETGIVAIDGLIPIGKGQRELLIGNRSTGKTAIAIDTIIHQKNKDVICIFVSIGNKQSTTARIIDTLERKGALEYTIILEADANDSALSQFFAPYSGAAIAEYFMHKGKDVLIVYDDLSSHAVAYRELSLLLRRAPGREAYPGDIFYIHSRLLERACKLSSKNGGGSITALPIIQTQGGDFSAFIPTNLISITDGQIFLDSGKFNQGVRPAIDIGVSVSRVGGSAQTKAIKKVAGKLKLDLAQYAEMVSFSQFGSELDKSSQEVLERGKIALEILKQGRFESYSFVDQTIFLFLLKERVLDDFKLELIKKFVVQCASFIKEVHADLYSEIERSGDLTDDSARELKAIAEEFSIIFPKIG
jgi:F-type H+/Na+-transporting ATPase subunit alpha